MARTDMDLEGGVVLMSFKRVALGAVAIFIGIGLLLQQSARADDLRIFALDEPLSMTLEDAPADMALVTSAIVARMRGPLAAEATAPVTFAPTLTDRLLERRFRYDGFFVETITISFIGPANSWEPGRRLYGTIHFADLAGRKAATAFGVEYLFDDGEVYVSDVALRVAAAPVPDIRLYLLRANMAADMMKAHATSHLALLSFLTEHALDVTAETGACDCVVAAVALDRIPANAHLYASVGDRRSGNKIVQGDHYLLDFEGWRVSLLEAEINLGADSNQDVQALYAPPLINPDARPTLTVASQFVPGEVGQ